MFEKCKKYFLLFFVFCLFVFNIFIFYFVFKENDKDFIFAMLDVGQGDALFVQSPTGVQMLVDGGPNKEVISELTRIISPFDRHIDALMITNPDKDHIAGFIDILKIYKVDVVLESGTLTDSKIYQNLRNEIEKRKIPMILVKEGMKLDMGGGAFVDILFPNQDVSSWPTNDGSIVARLSYGDTSVMLTGDATVKTENIILEKKEKDKLQSSILKVGHHGSRTSTSYSFLRAVNPFYAFISDGKNNKYGHPHEDTLQALDSLGVKVLRTDILGTIVLKCAKINVCKINK